MSEKRLIYEFDDVRVETGGMRVCKAGRAVPLEPKAFEVLVLLLERRGRLVEKSELLDAVWRDAFVTPNAMTRVIAQLRRSLGDDAREARYIETVPTRGYRFIAEVKALEDEGVAADPSPQPARQPTRLPVAGARLWIGGAAAVLILALAGFFLWQRAAGAADGWPEVLFTSQLTSSPGLDAFPAFSPDGNAIAYSSDRGGRFEIYIRPLSAGGREVQVTADGGDNLQPAWSPDGRQLAYHSRRRGGIWVVPALGGVSAQVSAFGADPAFSPDGEWIVFQSDGVPDLAQAAFGAMPPSTIWIVSARGAGAPRQITRVGQPSGGHGAPAFSPDGRSIVFATYDIDLSQLWSVAPDGSDLKMIAGDERTVYFDPIFSPDGNFLYFSTGGGNFRFWKMRIKQGTAAGAPMQVANTGAQLARHLSIAPDGKRIIYSALGMINNIGSVRLGSENNGGPEEQEGIEIAPSGRGAPVLLTQDTNYRKTRQTFSPDGSKIAYSVWRMGAEGEIWVMDADGSNARQITYDPAKLLGWLPGGERIAVGSKQEPRRLFAVEIGSGQRTPLAELGTDGGLGRLSPDGTRLAFNSRQSGTINVWTADIDGSAARQLTFDEEMMGFPCWSPDGRWMAVEMKRGTDTHIATVESDSGKVEQLTFEKGQSWPGDFSPDGERIVFAGERDGIWNIYQVSRRDRRVSRITDYAKPNTYVRYPSWSPRGDQIVYEYAETRGNVWMVTLR